MELSEALSVGDIHTTQFDDLVPEAKSVLRRLMHNSGDVKLQKATAVDILEAAGAKKVAGSMQVVPIMIKESDVKILVSAVDEYQKFGEVPDE